MWWVCMLICEMFLCLYLLEILFWFFLWWYDWMWDKEIVSKDFFSRIRLKSSFCSILWMCVWLFIVVVVNLLRWWFFVCVLILMFFVLYLLDVLWCLNFLWYFLNLRRLSFVFVCREDWCNCMWLIIVFLYVGMCGFLLVWMCLCMILILSVCMWWVNW